jgi:hypothetical protein
VHDSARIERIKDPRLVVGALPHVILFGGVLLMLVVHPNAVRSALMSNRALLVNAGLLTAWLVLAFVILPRVVRNRYVRGAVLTVGAVAAVWVLVLPTLHDTRVVEAFPMSESALLRAPEEPSAVPDGTAPPSTTVPRPLPVSTGSLHGIDHDASGVASVYRQPDGAFVVGLENIDIEPGPDYHVYVVDGADREDRDNAIYLAPLRGNRGTQYYELPGSAGAVGDGWTVLIWCRVYGVPIANATQHAP